MNEEIKQRVFPAVEEQVTIITLIKQKLDEELGESTYPADLIIAALEQVNKWLITEYISQREHRVNPMMVKLHDGEKRTIDVKDTLKEDGWKYDKDGKFWYKIMLPQQWKKVAGTEPYRHLKATFDKAAPRGN